MADRENSPPARQLTHVDESGAAKMVSVTQKPVTFRRAIAQASCRMSPEAAEAIRENVGKKGDVLQVARLAGIGAAKRTDELIPLCHSVPLDMVEVEFEWLQPTLLSILVQSTATAKTGVEMEAMVGASLAALTVYDMCKAIDRELTIESVQLVMKSGGARGDFKREQRDVS